MVVLYVADAQLSHLHQSDRQNWNVVSVCQKIGILCGHIHLDHVPLETDTSFAGKKETLT